MVSPPSRLSSSSSEPHNRKKRQRSESKGFLHGVNQSISDVNSVNSLAPGWKLPPLDGKEVVGDEIGDGRKFGGISEEIEDAISRIESLIPSLQKLVNSVHTPSRRSDGSNSGVSNAAYLWYCSLDLVPKRALLYQIAQVRNGLHQGVSMVSNQDNQVLGKSKAIMDRVGSLKWGPGGTESMASQTLGHVQGLRIMPFQVRQQSQNQSRNNQRKGIVKDATLRSNRMCKFGESDHKWISNRTKRKFTLEKGSLSRSIKKSAYGVLQSKALQEHQSSEESSRGSPSASSGASPEIGSCSSSHTYEITNESDESDVEHGDDGSTRDDDDLSYYSSEDQYSDTSHLSQRSEASPYKRDRHLKQGKGAGRFRRFKNKLGKIFHHHHHHHHHHHYNDDDEVGYVRSFWRQLGGIFHHTRKSDHRGKPKANKSRKTVIKSEPNKKQQRGHFHGLFDRLMNHFKHSNSKKPKDGIRRLKSSLHGSMQKIVGVRMPNRARVKLANRARRPSLAAPKTISKQ